MIRVFGVYRYLINDVATGRGRQGLIAPPPPILKFLNHINVAAKYGTINFGSTQIEKAAHILNPKGHFYLKID